MSTTLNRLLAGSLFLGIGSFIASQSFFIVPGGHHGLVFDRWRGVKSDTVLGEGLHFLIPFWQWPILISTRITPKKLQTQTQSRDLQTVNIGLRVLYRPNIPRLPDLFKEYAHDYAERTLPGIGNDVMKSVVAKYDAEQLITQRPEVSAEIRNRLTERAGLFMLDLQDVAITDLGFGPEFTHAIERKQVAQQEAEMMKFMVQKSEQLKLAAVIKAEGESEAAKLISQATSEYGNAFVKLRRIEAAREVVRSLSKSNKVHYVPSGESGANVLLSVPTSRN